MFATELQGINANVNFKQYGPHMWPITSKQGLNLNVVYGEIGNYSVWIKMFEKIAFCQNKE